VPQRQSVLIPLETVAKSLPTCCPEHTGRGVETVACWKGECGSCSGGYNQDCTHECHRNAEGAKLVNSASP
jgi:hypothetical protein